MALVRRWRQVVTVVGVCVLMWLCFGLLFGRPGKQQARHHGPASLPLPRGHFIKSEKDTNTNTWAHEPRVLCMVVTSPWHYQGRASHVKATWGQWGKGACPNTVFLTSAPNNMLDNVILSNFSSYEGLWGKVLDGFLQLNVTAADWFLKADDDTFLLYPNLLKLLAPLDPSKPLYLGLPLIYRPEEGREVTYMSGGAGYVLSRAALARLQHHEAPAVPCRTPGPTAYEDVNMGYCMDALGVHAVDTRDSLGRQRFLPCPPWRFLQPEPHPDLDWLLNFSKYKIRLGAESLSDVVVSFHEIRDPNDFYLLQFFIYDLKPLPTATPPH